MTIYLRAVLIFLAVVSGFNLGRYSVDFSGSATGWVALICSIVVLAMCVYLIRIAGRADPCTVTGGVPAPRSAH
jgi:hypothetical protein